MFFTQPFYTFIHLLTYQPKKLWNVLRNPNQQFFGPQPGC